MAVARTRRFGKGPVKTLFEPHACAPICRLPEFTPETASTRLIVERDPVHPERQTRMIPSRRRRGLPGQR